MKYTLESIFGLSNPTGKKAALGTIFHKVMELRGQASKALALDKSTFIDDNFGEMHVKEAIKPIKMLELSFDYYSKENHHLVFDTKDFKEITKWIDNTLDKYQEYDPLNLPIIDTEVFFDFSIDEEWAKINVPTSYGIDLTGNLSLRGTMDSVIDWGNGVYELLDYKTGEIRKDFATGEEKDLEYLKNDIQLLFYLVALKKLYPDKEFILTLFYIRNGGIFSVPADDKMLERGYDMIKETFTKISQTYNPKQLDPTHRDWRCKYVCEFSKPHPSNPNISMCNFVKQQINLNGFNNTVKNFADLSKINKYGSGGGRSDK